MVVSVGALGAGPWTGLFAQDLRQLVARAEALGARTGVAIADGAGEVLFLHRGSEAFTPASNMKVLTAAAVLQGLGADFEFVTTFRLAGGALVVDASGDPNWISGGPHDPAVVFATVAQALRERGVRQVAAIRLEPGRFLGPLRPPSWPADQLTTWYCAPTGPFVLEQGTLSLRIAASAQAMADVRLLAPVADAALRGSIAMVERGVAATYGAVDQRDGVLLRGRFPRGASAVTIRTAVADPAAWYEAALRRALREAGIAVGGEGAAVPDQVVHRHRSGLRQAVLRMLEDSSNFDAEQCLRVLGDRTRGDGSLASGVAAMQVAIERLVGRLPAGIVFADGSGLSRQNQVTPGLVLTALLRARGTPVGGALLDCLPVSGRSGTLAGRFQGTDLVGRVRAKTGWIRGASALSGVLERRNGSVRCFSILMNYNPKQDGLNKDLKRLQEEIVRALDRSEI